MIAGYKSECIGNVLKLERRVLEIDPMAKYELIGVYSFGKGIFHREPTIGSDLGAYRFSLIKDGDLVLSNIQAWEGAIALAGPQDDGCIGTHRFMTYVPIDERIDPSFLRYFLLSEQGMDLIRKASPGSIARNRTLGIKAFESLEIPLPPIEVQHDIAQKLCLIREATLRMEQLQSKTRLVAGALLSSLAQRSDLSDQDKTARKWKRIPLREVMRPVVDSHTVQPGQTYPNVGILSFGRGLFEKPPIDASHTSARTLNRIHAGQFIYSRLFAFEGAYASVPKQFDCYYVSSEFPTFELDSVLDADFLAAYIRSPAIWEELGRLARGLGVRRQRIHVDTLLDFEIWLPPISTQRLVRQQLQRLQQRQDAHTRAARLMSALVPSALNEAFASLT